MSGAPAMKFIADAPLGDGLKAMTKVCSHGKRLLFLSQPSRTATSPRRGHAASTCRLLPLWQLLGAAAAALGSRRLGAHRAPLSLLQEEKKAALAAKKAERKEKKGGSSADLTGGEGSSANLEALSLEPGSEAAAPSHDKGLLMRTVTGVLTSRPTSRDIKIDSFSLGLNGQQLVQDCSIELTIGRRRACCPRRRGLVAKDTDPQIRPPGPEWQRKDQLPAVPGQPRGAAPVRPPKPVAPHRIIARCPFPCTWTSTTCARRRSRPTAQR